MARARSLDLTPRVSPLAASLRMPASPSRAPASDVAPPAPEDVITRGLWNRARDLRCVRRHLGASEGGADSVVVRCARLQRPIKITDFELSHTERVPA